MVFFKVLDSGAMTEDVLETYLNKMAKHGEWGDGIMLSAAVRLYQRPIIILTPEGQIQTVDTCDVSSAEPIRLGLINSNHYLSICKMELENDTMQECRDNASIKQSSESECNIPKTLADESNKDDVKTIQVTKEPSDENQLATVTLE